MDVGETLNVPTEEVVENEPGVMVVDDAFTTLQDMIEEVLVPMMVEGIALNVRIAGIVMDAAKCESTCVKDSAEL